jgi:hypothetical protein
MAHAGIRPILFLVLCASAPAATQSQALEARGPGAVFASIEAAAVDALTYAYLQAQAAHNSELMRGGTIHTTRGGYSYGEIRVTKRLRANKLDLTLEPRDVARFHIYPRGGYDANRINERPSRADRRSVDVIDPLHRPLYILHPSLAIRVYRGKGHELTQVASLRRLRPSHAARARTLALGVTEGMSPP